LRGLESLRVKVFADGANPRHMCELNDLPYVQGFTTNPTLMRRAGVTSYRAFAREVLAAITAKPVSFEVLADDFETMERQALEIAGWADNVYVKIPVTNTRGEPAVSLVRRLARRGVKVNVTAVMTLAQAAEVAAALEPGTPGCVSIFAGRIADTGVDPVPLMSQAAQLLQGRAGTELMWASPRELLNVLQADAAGCHIITLTSDLLGKLALLGRDLGQFSLETVKMFYADAQAAGFSV